MAWPFCTGFGKWVVPGWVAKSTQDTQDSAGWLKHGLRFGRSSHLASWRFVPPLCWTNLVADFSSLNTLFRGSRLKCWNPGPASHSLLATLSKCNPTRHQTSLVNLYQTSSTLRLRLCMNWAPARLFLPSASLTAWQVQLPRLWQTPRLATEVQKRLKYTIIQTNLFLIPTL